MANRSAIDVYCCRNMPAGDDAALLDDTNQRQKQTAGVSVNHYTALTHNPVYAAVNRISGDLAKLPFVMHRKLEPGYRAAREPAISHPTYNVVLHKPNELLGAFRFWQTFYFHALMWSNGYAYIDMNEAGQCVGLLNLPPDRTYPQYNYQSGQWDLFLTVTDDGRQWTLPAYRVLDVVGLQFDLSNMMDLTKLAAHNWGTGMAGNKFINEFFSNGNHAGGFLEVPPETTPESAINLAEAIEQKNSGLVNAFRIMVLRDGAKYHQTTVRPVDAQMAELLAGNVKDVSRWFNLPASKLNADDGGVYGSREQDARDYIDSTLSPWMRNTSDQCRLKLLTTDAQRRDRYCFEHDASAMLRPESVEFMNYIKTGIEVGVFSPNDGRAMLNMPPRPGGDVYYHSNNMQDPAEQETPPADDPPPPNDDDKAAEERRLFEVEAARIGGEFRAKAKWHQARRRDAFAEWWKDNWRNVATPYIDDLQVRAKVLGIEQPVIASTSLINIIAKEFDQ